MISLKTMNFFIKIQLYEIQKFMKKHLFLAKELK